MELRLPEQLRASLPTVPDILLEKPPASVLAETYYAHRAAPAGT